MRHLNHGQIVLEYQARNETEERLARSIRSTDSLGVSKRQSHELVREGFAHDSCDRNTCNTVKPGSVKRTETSLSSVREGSDLLNGGEQRQCSRW